MSDDMLTDKPAERMWTLSDDRETVRVQLPPLLAADMPDPLRIHLDFDAEMVDEVLEQLTGLYAGMLPAPQRNWPFYPNRRPATVPPAGAK